MATGPDDTRVVATFERLRADPGMILLEGFHALKHALRFGAVIEVAVTPDAGKLRRLTESLAPDLAGQLGFIAVVSSEAFRALAGRDLTTPVVAIARRRTSWSQPALGDAPAVVLYDPKHAGNAGAVVRVAAAAGARCVRMYGLDPWAPQVVRAAAGLQYAIEVASVEAWPAAWDARTLAFDPDGEPLSTGELAGSVLVFGSERHGIPDNVLEGMDAVVRLPMTEGVSSLNLATSVSAALYLWRATHGRTMGRH